MLRQCLTLPGEIREGFLKEVTLHVSLIEWQRWENRGSRVNSRVPTLHLLDPESDASFSFGPWVPRSPHPQVSPGEQDVRVSSEALECH